MPATFAEQACLRIDRGLQRYLSLPAPADVLQQAMAYAVLNPGKRLRPQLVYLTGQVLGADWEALDPPACAIELIHTYSLIHDDLPAMDDAPLRRGRPSCHRQFSEATAILAGDALQPLAFEILARHPAPLHPEQRIEMIRILAAASGATGMAAGQSLDLSGPPEDAAALVRVYALKTGALLSACTDLGAIAAGLHDNPLEAFGKHLGLAFQIQDDLLDMEGTNITLGKMPGIDQRNQKMTYPLLTSIAASRNKVTELFEMAMDSIPLQGLPRQQLQTFVESVLGRTK